ncbi:uncharacterized protein BXZ73DRAFT_99661 [Epithele typhae]|uniref:uncharacterized protein n=1 Tax=Epithele typhae TaxID=378194 RepID=UPI00200744A0|nr:uncharacterized protein BXZ73DRAFT_99661 [Epithele typhae]KAH9938986.1 hypothetical protein BXZ73DRAFT_99661 [Epithele typhae]
MDLGRLPRPDAWAFAIVRSVSARATEDQTAAVEHGSGAVLIGGLIALYLSGIVFMQTVLYVRMYSASDPQKVKVLVGLVWSLDLLHSAMVCAANWQNLIVGFGDFDKLDYITWSIAVTVALTAATTFIVHCFFSHRIHTLSRGNWYITVPLISLALLRLASDTTPRPKRSAFRRQVAATVSTSEMIRLESFRGFVTGFGFVFTLGLATSTALDVLITGILCFYLRRRKSGLVRMDRIIGTLTLYTVENGLLTCLTTAVSLICWVRMQDNLIFLGLHLAISKLYANSFLASLNARKHLSGPASHSASDGYPLPVVFPQGYGVRNGSSAHGLAVAANRPAGRAGKPLQVSVNVEQTVHQDRGRSRTVSLDCGTPPAQGVGSLESFGKGETC